MFTLIALGNLVFVHGNLFSYFATLVWGVACWEGQLSQQNIYTNLQNVPSPRMLYWHAKQRIKHCFIEGDGNAYRMQTDLEWRINKPGVGGNVIFSGINTVSVKTLVSVSLIFPLSWKSMARLGRLLAFKIIFEYKYR